MKRVEKSIYIGCLILLCLCIAIFPYFCVDGLSYATEKAYTNVLDDLKKDSTFDTANYPDNADDNSLQVITVAESEDNELFVYVYQPSALTRQLTAASIDLSTTIYDEIAFHNYPLRLLSRQGVFAKYRVEYLTINHKGTRYYAITDILRPWVEGVDEAATGGNIISEVTFSVAKQWEFGELNNKPYVRVVDIETIEITSKYCGFVRYDDGCLFHEGACDSHFVAFDTDRSIDKLLEADVYYTYQSYEHVIASGYGGPAPEFGDKLNAEITVKSDQEVDYNGGGLFSTSFTWQRIQTPEEFISSVEFDKRVYQGGLFNVSYSSLLNDEAKDLIKNSKWVLRFLETDWENKVVNPLLTTTRETKTIVGDVKILRLKFVTDGKTYNLGVVDNKQSGDPFNPSNDDKYTITVAGWIKDSWDVIKKVLIALLVVGVLVLVIWIVCKIVSIFRRPKVVIKGDKDKKHKE